MSTVDKNGKSNMIKGANRYQKVVDQNRRESNFGVYQTTLPKNLLLKGYFCPEQELSALNFPGRAEKVVVHMHWLTW